MYELWYGEILYGIKSMRPDPGTMFIESCITPGYNFERYISPCTYIHMSMCNDFYMSMSDAAIYTQTLLN